MISFQDSEFQFGFERALGASYRQAADVGEVLATAERITDGDGDSWLREWTATAGAAWASAVRARESGRRMSALAHFRRAATYYATALFQISHSSEPDRQLDLWRRQRACWEQIVDLCPVPGERISIAYEDTALPGFFFPAPGAAGRVRPLVVVNNGSYQATSEMWAQAGAAAAERGYHWLTFDGPGQQATLFEQRIPCRPDWEAVLTPVLDAMLMRRDVDRGRVAVIGMGQGGYWVARALAFEHRFAAAVVDPGIVDVVTAWTDRLSSEMRRQLEDRRQSAFDREMHLAELFAPASTETLRFHGQPYGHNGGSTFRLLLTIAGYHLGGELAQIKTPLLITESEGEELWPGQSRQLYDGLTGPRELATFTAREGAGGHGEPLGQALRETRIFDWLARHLG
ncbi:MAG TPA: prolyl oligopeptidase family serine peptidase [Solirubrobacteraceae bacterium]|nr:prolyl oligopeptidase family serine peptidase [Solirubrobacteraceae bacterium]